jgi:hypothetical protein
MVLLSLVAKVKSYLGAFAQGKLNMVSHSAYDPAPASVRGLE